MHQRIYLDYAATTPVDSRVLAVMEPYFMQKFGNPGSLHSFGQEAIAAVDHARETIAKHIGADFREVIFTASATEANNLALQSAVMLARRAGLKNPKVIISAVEHESVLETARSLERDGVDIVYVPVDANGVIDLETLQNALDARSVLVSVMYANNEIGTIQPIRHIAQMVKEFRASARGGAAGGKDATAKQNNVAAPFPLVHTDAAQAFQFLDCMVTGSTELGVDLMTISSHKLYGPKGAGALYVRDPRMFVPQLVGGGQEFGLRSGTENVASIVGFAKAVELICECREEENKRLAELKQTLWRGIKEVVPNAEINGVEVASKIPPNTLPNILNVYFPGHEAQDLLTVFDLKGLAVSSGSACRSRALEASYVVQELGHSLERAKSSIRFSVGRSTTEETIVKTLAIICETFSRKSS